MENYLPKWGLQILSRTFFDDMYILCFALKKHYIYNNFPMHCIVAEKFLSQIWFMNFME